MLAPAWISHDCVYVELVTASKGSKRGIKTRRLAKQAHKNKTTSELYGGRKARGECENSFLERDGGAVEIKKKRVGRQLYGDGGWNWVRSLPGTVQLHASTASNGKKRNGWKMGGVSSRY